MKINPVLKKEINLYSRNIKTSWILFGFNLILSGVAAFLMFQNYNSNKFYEIVDYTITSKLYIVLAYIEFAMLILLVPISASGSISGERERKTLDILLSTQLKPYQIVLGKIEASLFMVMILIISSMPIFGLTFMFGGINFMDMLMLILILLLEAVLLAVIAIFFSSIFEKTSLATIATYFVLIFMTVGSYIIVKVIHYLMQQQHMGSEKITDIKNLIVVLLINPAVTFSGMISMQVGDKKEILDICSKFGEYGNSFLVAHWITISITLQMIVAIILFVLTTRNIDPYKKTYFKKEN